ncbi:MAG TPA: DNA replication/repair protein RecF [Allosphingosinicella sp.]
MYVARLSLTDFRSYADALVVPGPGLVILTGENGAGKTNLLEAVSLLAPGRGLRGAALSEMPRRGGAGGFAVAARLGGLEIGTGTMAAAPERRQVRVNGVAAPANALSERLSVIWLTPAMDRLFADTASARRRFLDRLVLALIPSHAREAARYEAAMRQRNKLLAEEAPADPEWLNALEARMAEHGCRLADNRARTAQALHERLAGQPEGPFARAGLMLEGWQPDHGDPLALQRELGRARAQDAAAGRTLQGPHRMDLAVTHLGKDQPAALCSTGEQKALLIGLILAHAALVGERAGRRPILLLDEVAAHLDPTRRAALFGRLEAEGGQVWMTGTEHAPFHPVGAGAAWFEVRDGAIRGR